MTIISTAVHRGAAVGLGGNRSAGCGCGLWTVASACAARNVAVELNTGAPGAGEDECIWPPGGLARLHLRSGRLDSPYVYFRKEGKRVPG